MHAASVILLCWAMIGAACFYSQTMAGVTAGVLAVLVALIGLPHGAADHRFARPRLEPVLGMAWLPVFLAGWHFSWLQPGTSARKSRGCRSVRGDCGRCFGSHAEGS